MPRRNMNVFIHTYPFFDNVQLHLPGAEVTLKHEAAFTDTCMRWVEKPVIEPEPGIALRSVQGSISEGVQSTPAEPSRLGRDSSAKATTPVKRRYAKRKRTPVLKANVLTPVVVPRRPLRPSRPLCRSRPLCPSRPRQRRKPMPPPAWRRMVSRNSRLRQRASRDHHAGKTRSDIVA
jgi:hypothetical protein